MNDEISPGASIVIIISLCITAWALVASALILAVYFLWRP